MVQKSGIHQLRLVVEIPLFLHIFTGGFTSQVGFLAGFCSIDRSFSIIRRIVVLEEELFAANEVLLSPNKFFFSVNLEDGSWMFQWYSRGLLNYPFWGHQTMENV